MFLVAARALAEQVNDSDLDVGLVYPPLENIRAVSLKVAAAVATYAFNNNLAQVTAPSNLMEAMKDNMYYPAYSSSLIAKL